MSKVTDVNTSVTNASTSSTTPVFALKQLLKNSASWTVRSSSDGTTYNAAGDQITLAGSGAGGLNNTNAWFVVRDPGGVREFCIQRIGASYSYRIKYSPSAHFSGGTPGATRVPSATDEQVLCGGGTDAAPTGTSIFETGSGVNYRYHAVAYTTAIGGVYGFWLYCTVTPGSTQANGVIACEPMAPGSYNVGDTDPCVVNAGTGYAPSAVMSPAASPAFAACTVNVGIFDGTLGTDPASGNDCAGYPEYKATYSGSARCKGSGAAIVARGQARAWPQTANRATDSKVYLGSYGFPFADNTEPGV